MSAGKLSTQAARTRKTVLIVDDHPMMRNGLAQAINSERDLKVSAQAENSHQAMNAIRIKKFDLAIVDISLHGKGGLELIKDMRVEAPQTLILVVSIHDELLYAERALRAGANGYIMKDAGGETLLKAIRHILGGQVYVSHEIASKILTDFSGRRSVSSNSPFMQLSDREFEVFELLGQGKGSHEIGKQLSLSPKTVDAHRSRIKQKLKLGNGPELIRYAVRWVETQNPIRPT